MSGLRILFVKEALAWPRSSGHDVHAYHLMRALAGLGHEVGLLTAATPAAEAVAGLPRVWSGTFPAKGVAVEGPAPRLSWLQERYRRYWGIDEDRIREVGRVAEEMSADAVVVVGLGVLPYLGAVRNRLRVWYAADEWLWHHVTQFRFRDRQTWPDLKDGIIKGVYERAYGSLLDRVWVVTRTDRDAMRWVAGVRGVDLMPNGVDADHFCPVAVPQRDRSCTFWGRLDFGPNVQGLEWFCREVWPRVRREAPDARFAVYGFHPTPRVQALVGKEGIELVADLPDLRAEVASHPVVVLPFVSGGGIKNKLLEAAAMGKAIVCSPIALQGLRKPAAAGMTPARTPADWARAIVELWRDAARRQRAGAAARAWAVANHSWETAARTAVAGMEQSLRGG